MINLLKVSALTMQLKECLDFVFNLLKVSVLTMQSKYVWILCLTSWRSVLWKCSWRSIWICVHHAWAMVEKVRRVNIFSLLFQWLIVYKCTCSWRYSSRNENEKVQFEPMIQQGQQLDCKLWKFKKVDNTNAKSRHYRLLSSQIVVWKGGNYRYMGHFSHPLLTDY